MTDLAGIFALVVGLANALAAALGAAGWLRADPPRAFWPAIRAGQLAAGAQAIAAGVLAIAGFAPDDRLYWLYAVLPVAVGFMAEQLRAVSAQTVLERRGFDSAQEVGELDEAGQRSVVLSVVLREMGVMALAAGVVVFLAWRAAVTAGALG